MAEAVAVAVDCEKESTENAVINKNKVSSFFMTLDFSTINALVRLKLFRSSFFSTILQMVIFPVNHWF